MMPIALQGGESIILASRRHWAYLLWRLGGAILVAVVPPILFLLFMDWTFGLDGGTATTSWIIALVWFVGFGIRAYFVWYSYQHDVWVVTNQRIVDARRNHWFHNAISSADLVDVEDMSVERNGIWATMFKYGNVRCQTAGAEQKFTLSGVPSPTEVMTTIDGARDAARRGPAAPPAPTPAT